MRLATLALDSLQECCDGNEPGPSLERAISKVKDLIEHYQNKLMDLEIYLSDDK